MRVFGMFCLALIAYLSITVSGNTHYLMTNTNKEWWTTTIIYQVYPRSFKDSNNDGVGDIKGITQKLDHFVDLGIETLWIGPIFKSPMDDMGYDIQNYTEIDPIFGTMEDFDELISEMNKRNLKFITDFVPNHSSSECEWFQKSIKREGKYADYYVWRDAKNQEDVIANSSIKPIPPNNWISLFGGPAWKWNSERKQFYYHEFKVSQPDFNLRNNDVHQELFDVMEFWLNKGVAGFRIDAITSLYEDERFLDEPYLPGKNNSKQFDDLDHIYTMHQPENVDIIYSWRDLMDNYTKKHNTYPKVIALEAYAPLKLVMQMFGNETRKGAQIPFNFVLLYKNRDFLLEQFEASINKWMTSMPKDAVANWVIENHDNQRLPFFFGTEIVPLITAMKLALPGIEITYYGAEIGMEQTYMRVDQYPDKVTEDIKDDVLQRSYSRSPMQWDDSENAGFTGAKKPWLPVNPNYYKLNVETQKKMPNSNYNFYKKMSQLRKTDTFKYGNLDTYNISKSIYILERSLANHEKYVVVMNFGSEVERIVVSETIVDLNNTLYVHVASENSGYNQGDIITENVKCEHLLKLRPQSVVVLSEKYTESINPSTNDQSINKNSRSDGSQTKSTFIGLLCSILFIRFVW